MIMFGGIWRINRNGINLNEGGHLAGLYLGWTVQFFDLWFKLPIRGARTFRVSAFRKKLVIGLR